MTDANLLMFISNLVNNMTRDAVEFAIRGVTAIDTTDLKALGDAFELFPPDSFYQSDVSLAVQTKNSTHTGLIVDVRNIIDTAIIEWGEGSPQYKKFGTKNMTNLTDRSFLVACRQVVTTATGFLASLTGVGLTQAMIDTVSTNAETFELNLNSVNDMIEQRDLKTQERITDGNTLYAFVVKYAQIGKLIWDDVDEAKYNDYVIYPTVNSGLGKVLNLVGVYIPAAGGELASIDLSWSAVTGADGYDVFVSIVPIGDPAVQFALLGGAPGTTFQHTPLPTIPSDYYYKVHAVNPAGIGADSDQFKVEAT
jgi:hypothetical protein